MENITEAPVVSTDMVLTTSPILKKVNILLIQEGVDWSQKTTICLRQLSQIWSQASSKIKYGSFLKYKWRKQVHSYSSYEKIKLKRVSRSHLLEEKDDSNIPFFTHKRVTEKGKISETNLKTNRTSNLDQANTFMKINLMTQVRSKSQLIS